MSRILVFDRRGVPLDELDALTTRSWIVSGEGGAEFTVAIADPKCNEKNLRYGNFIVIQRDGLPDWCGVLDGGRDWDVGNVKIYAYTLERLLKNCATKIQKLTGSAGSIFAQLLDMYNASGVDLPIIQRDIYRGGEQREETLGDQIYEHVRRVQERSGNDWQIIGQIGADGRLALYADWLETLGGDNGIVLQDGNQLTLASPLMQEYTPIWNRVTGLGDAATDGTRLSVTVEDTQSIGLYGVRSTAIVFSGNTKMDTLTQNAREYLRVNAYPRLQVNAETTAQFAAQMRLGDTYSVELTSVGFNGIRINARLTAMQYSDEKNKLELTMVTI